MPNAPYTKPLAYTILKRTFLSIYLFLSLCLAVNAQNYLPALADSMSWYVLCTFEGSWTEDYYLSYDTTIYSKNYKILRDYNNNDNLGYYREDTLLKKIFYLPNSNIDTLEFVVCDFSLQENDSLLLYSYFNNYDTIGWYFIDSIRNYNSFIGPTRIFYLSGNLYGNSGYPIWIEGIGTIGSPISSKPGYTISEWWCNESTCIYKNDSVVFHSENYYLWDTTCYIFYTGIEDHLISKNISVFPNPTNNKITVDIDNKEINSITAYNSFGQKVSVVDNQNTISLGKLSDGLYIIKVDVEGYYYFKQIILRK